MTEVTYKSIFKSTFLFAFVKVFTILTKLIVNKSAALFLGTAGLGLIGLLQTTINLVATLCGLGISKSAIRDISANNTSGNKRKLFKVISITNALIFLSSFLGAMITIVMSSALSRLTFGNEGHSISFLFLSIAVFFTILNEGKLAILTGMRKLTYLAKASILGCIFGITPAVPLYYYFGQDGIVPSLILVPVISFFFTLYYAKKMNNKAEELSISLLKNDGAGMLKMGLSLMYVSLWVFFTEYIIKTYIVSIGSLEIVGIFQAGSTIVMGYFGIITTSMATEYYPRISAIHNKNHQLNNEVNKQAKVGLVILLPMVVFFLLFLPTIVQLLYTEDFLGSIDYIQYAIFGAIIIACSNPMGMILLAKQNVKVFLFSITLSRVVGLILSIYFFNNYGLKGLGLAYLAYALFELFFMQALLNLLYGIKLNFRTIKILTLTLLLCSFSFFVNDIPDLINRFYAGILVFMISISCSFQIITKTMKIDIKNFIKMDKK